MDAIRIAECSVGPKSSFESVTQIVTMVILKLVDGGFIRSFCENLIYSWLTPIP